MRITTRRRLARSLDPIARPAWVYIGAGFAVAVAAAITDLPWWGLVLVWMVAGFALTALAEHIEHRRFRRVWNRHFEPGYQQIREQHRGMRR